MKLRSLNVKSPWHGKTWNGNELKKIMKEIPKLESNKNFPEDLKVFTKTFQYILNLDKGVSGRKLAPNYEALIDQLSTSLFPTVSQLLPLSSMLRSGFSLASSILSLLF